MSRTVCCRKNKKIDWDLARPRIAGRWQQILRGQNNVHLSVYPVSESIMETISDDIGHIAYVEKVFPDESIIISEIGWPEIGQYSERTLTKEEWREFKPIFIAVAQALILVKS